MKILAQLRSFVSALTDRARLRDEIDEELRAHIEDRASDLERSGLSRVEAERAARLEFGGYEKFKQECREARGTRIVDSLLQDVRYTFRMQRKYPGFSAVAILTLALGIGVTTAILSIVDPVLFRPLPYANADRLVSVGIKHAAEPFEFMMGSFYYTWSDHQTAFTEMTAQSAGPRPCDLTERDAVRLNCSYVHQNFLPTLGVTPVVGSNFTTDDMLPNAPLSALLTYSLWKSRYNEQPSIVNQVIEVDGGKARVVGVLPRDFEMPSGQPADLLLPRQIDVAAVRTGSAQENMRVFARLKDGVTAAQARAALEPAFDESLKFAPAEMRSEMHLIVRSVRDRQMHDVIPVAWIMFGAVLVVLLVCCANAGSLFLARTAVREREFAIRTAMGASKRRILCQTLTEGLLISAASAVAGWIVAEELPRAFAALAPDGMAFLRKATLDWRVLLATIVMSFACGVVCGLLPLLELRGVGLAARTSQTSIRPRLRRMLVVTQIASSVLLSSAAVLLLRSLEKMEAQDFGVNSAQVITAPLSVSMRGYDTSQKRMEFFRRAVADLSGVPGFVSVALADSLPPNGSRHWYSSMAIAGRPPIVSQQVVGARAVTAEYFNTLRIRIVRGRGFSEADASSTEHLMVINQSLAALMFPNVDPVGQQIQPDKDEAFYRVIGVAADTRNDGITAQGLPEYDTLLGSATDEWENRNFYSGTLIIRSALPVAAAAPWIRRQIAGIDRLIPVEVQTMDAQVRRLTARPRFETAVIGFFALAGLVMAVIGLYGVTAYTASRRTHEIGVRIALGASRGDVLRLIMMEGVWLVFFGGVIGLACALSGAHLLRSFLFLVGPYDAVSFVGVAVVLGVVGLAAILLPAVRAMRVDPVCAIRYE
ncbi:MAG TPA: ABC transporter permease [Candidatus Acidoferrum sp.]|jgi:predicted permease